MFLTAASLAQAIKALKRSYSRLCCLDTGSKPGWSTFFVGSFFFSAKNILFKKNHAVEAAKSRCLRSQRVEIHLQSFFTSKDGARKTEFIAYAISRKRSANQQIRYATTLFMSKQVSLPKISA